MILPVGTRIRSTRNYKEGLIVGYGSLMWPHNDNSIGDDGVLQPVYLVQIAPASSSLGPACAVFRADMIEEVPLPYKGTPGGYCDP